MRNYPAIIEAFGRTIWAILPEYIDLYTAIVNRHIFGLIGSPDAEEQDIQARARVEAHKPVKGDVAVIPLVGTIAQRFSQLPSGGTATDAWGADFDQLVSDLSIGAIVIDVDSPGGSVYGVSELAAKIRSARHTKPIHAVINSLGASAAYWIASAAESIAITPSGEAGSIGVIAVHTDQSEAEKQAGLKTTIIKAGKYKGEGNPSEPLTGDALAAIQSRVDDYYGMFVRDVARNRGVTTEEVDKKYGEGRVLGATDAKKAGLVDRIATLEQVIADLKRANSAGTRNKAAWIESERLRSCGSLDAATSFEGETK